MQEILIVHAAPLFFFFWGAGGALIVTIKYMVPSLHQSLEKTKKHAVYVSLWNLISYQFLYGKKNLVIKSSFSLFRLYAI